VVVQQEAWEWFAAAMLHDLGKTILDAQDQWRQKQLDTSLNPELKPGEIDLGQLLGQGVKSKIEQHHGHITATTTPPQAALVLADYIQKAMYAMRDVTGRLVTDDRGNIEYVGFNQQPPFYSYYGKIVPGWDHKSAADLLRGIKRILLPAAGKLNSDVIMAVERCLRGYPQTTYMGHISLELHHRFAGALFLLLLDSLNRLREKNLPYSQLTTFTFWVLTLTPHPLDLFYRLRDVRVQEQAVGDLRRDLFQAVFVDRLRFLGNVIPVNNPFEFFTGDGLVLVYDDPSALVHHLELSIRQRESLRAVSVDMLTYDVVLRWQADGSLRFVDPSDIHAALRQETLLPSDMATFPAISLDRCRRCNEPVSDPQEGGLCDSCVSLERLAILNLETAAADPGGTLHRLAYVFITLPSLRKHASQAACALLRQMKADRVAAGSGKKWQQRLAQAPDLGPTDLGLFEYLQAVLAVDNLRRDIEAFPDAYRLARFPELLIYVTREDRFLDFVDHLTKTLTDLRLEVGVQAMLTDLKTPIWSLMDRFAKHAGPVWALYETAGGEVVMFSDAEVKAIRELARFPRDSVTRAQLQALILAARRGSLEELKMEIEGRQKRRKIKEDFATALKNNLSGLGRTGSDIRDREKRALFIKNVANLGDFRQQ